MPDSDTPPLSFLNALRERAEKRFGPLQAAWLKLPGNVRGGIWVLCAALFLAVMTACIKLAGLRLHVTQILFMRQMMMLILASPAIARSFPGVLYSRRLDLQIFRVGTAFFAMLLAFTAVVHLPLAEATTIQFARNFFLTLLAIFFLGEIVGVRRWAALVVGFVGVVIVAWPSGAHAFNIYGVMAIGSAALVSVVTIFVRKLSQVDPPITILTYQAFGVGMLMMPFAIWFWKTPTLAEILLIVGIGLLSVFGQTCNILGLRAGEASAIAPLDYSKLLYAVLLGLILFNEWPEPRVFVGAMLIVAAAVYTLHRERVRAPHSTQPTSKPSAKDL